MHDFVLAPEGSFFIQRALSLSIMGFRSWNLNLMLTTIMSSYGINFVKKYLLVWLPFLLTFQISCVHRILKRVIHCFNFFKQFSCRFNLIFVVVDISIDSLAGGDTREVVLFMALIPVSSSQIAQDNAGLKKIQHRFNKTNNKPWC